MQNESTVNEEIVSKEAISPDQEMMPIEQEASDTTIEETSQNNEETTASESIRRQKKSYKHAYQEAVRQAEYYKLIAEQQAQQLIQKNPSKAEEAESVYQDPMTRKTYAANSPEAIVAKVLMEREQEINNARIQEEIQRKTTTGKAMIAEAKDDIDGFEDQYHEVFSEISGDAYKAIRHEILASPNPVALIQYYGNNLEDLKRIKNKSPDDQFREVVITSHALKKKPKIVTTANAPLPKPLPQRNVAAPKEDDPNAIFKAELAQMRNQFKPWGT